MPNRRTGSPGVAGSVATERRTSAVDRYVKAGKRRWLESQVAGTAELVERNRRRAELVLRRWRPVFIHGDLHVLHMFVEDDSVSGILDWSEAAPGDAAFDLASLTLAHPERLADLLDGYGDGIDCDLVHAWWSYRCLTAVRWLVENGYGPPEEYPEVAMLRSVSQ